jgi:hypothetical protein
MRRLLKIEIFLVVLSLVISSSAAFALEFLYEEDGTMFYMGDTGKIVCSAQMGAIVPNAPDYDWWYGCSPTSAGMLMGYYDIGGRYPNLVGGGVAELSTYGAGPYIANDAIASSGHIADFWVAYGHFGDDPDYYGGHGRDCLADFMGTSQDSCGNADGFTTFWWYLDGSPMRPADIISNGINPDKSGMYGIKEYIEWCGYTYVDLYNQLIDPYVTGGYSFSQFVTDIDVCRPQILHIVDHTMFAPGYDSSPWPQTVYVHDTWTAGPHTMQWGGIYPSTGGTDHYMMTILKLSTSPTAVALASFSADNHNGYVEVEWTTATELDNVGFNIYRSRSEDGTKTKINQEIIAARGDELKGATYSLRDYNVAGGSYYYWCEDVDLDGRAHMSHSVKVERWGTPRAFRLAQSVPAPMSPVRSIEYDLARDCHVKIEVFNVLGKKMATLVDEYQTAGAKVAQWNVGPEVASGAYFCKLVAGDFTDTNKMVVLK